MKTTFTNLKLYNFIIICLAIIISVYSNCYGQTHVLSKNIKENIEDYNFEVEYQRFLEKQKTTLLTANAEVFVLNGTAWERLYGEKEYCLTPTMQDVSEYNSRIRQLDDIENGIIKSKFHFLNVELTPLSKSLLSNMNIQVPDYVQDNVNVYLPEIDIDVLSKNGVNFNFLESYGQNEGKIIETKGTKSIIWSEGFEGDSSGSKEGFEGGFPDPDHGVSNWGSNDCGWDDVGCMSYSGSRSLWCADVGADCDVDCSKYVNYMETEFWLLSSSAWDCSCYIDVDFTFRINFNLYSPGTNDVLYRYYDIGSGWQQSSTSYDSGHSWDNTGWNQGIYGFTGFIPSYRYKFYFTSNWTGKSDGVYLDDLELYGTPNYPTANATTVQHTTCGECNGIVNASGGTSYSWNGGLGSGAYHSNVCAGTYTVTVTDAYGCTDTDQTMVNSSSGATANATTVQHTTCGECNGIVNASGGTSYSWSGGLGSGAYHSNVCAGTYTVTVTDANGCTDTDNTIVNSSSNPNANATTEQHTTCGDCNGIVDADASGGTGSYTYSWSGLGSGANHSNLCSGTYTVTVIDSDGCTDTDNTTVNSSTSVGIATITGNNSVNSCSSETYYASASNATSYSWTAPTDWSPNSGNGSSFTTTIGSISGEVCATPYNGSCEGEQGCKSVDVVPCNLSISQSIIDVDASSGNTSFTINAIGSWTINYSCSWITNITPSSGTGNTTVTVYYSENTLCSTNSCPITVTCCSETAIVTINQSKPQYSLFLIKGGTSNEDVYVEVNGTQHSLAYQEEFECNSNVNLYAVTPTSSNCSEFISWSGDLSGNTNPTSITMNSDKTVTANYELLQYDVIILSNLPDGGTTSGVGTYNCGETVTVIATPNTCYEFQNWTENGSQVSDDSSYTFNIYEDRNLVANYVLLQYNVTTSPNPSNGGTTSGDGTYDCDETVTVIASPNTDWYFANWTENSIQQTTDTFYSFNILDDRNLVANFSDGDPVVFITYPVEGEETNTIITVEGTAIDPNGSVTLVQVKLNNEDWVDASGTTSWSRTVTLVFGDNSIYAKAQDNDGNWSDEVYINVITDINKYVIDNSIKIYPNPANNSIYIEFRDNYHKIVKINIYNVIGKVIYTIDENKLKSNLITLDLSGYSNGIYYLNIQTENNKIVKKFSVIK